MTQVRIIIALFLLAAWPVMSSHALLQHFGFIHQTHENHDDAGGSHEHNTDHHSFADGDYLRGSSTISVWKPVASVPALPFLAAIAGSIESRIEPDVFHSGPAPPGTAPPELTHSWQFSFRTALPIRAPSLAP